MKTIMISICYGFFWAVTTMGRYSLRRTLAILGIGLLIGMLLGLMSVSGDVVYGEHPPIRTCDDGAYLIDKNVPMPPSFPPARTPWREFIGPRPENAALPALGTGALTYEEWTRQTMRRRNQ